MRIELELDDPEFCNGCPLLRAAPHNPSRLLCNLGYSVCRLSPEASLDIVEYVKDIPRPRHCRMRNGR